MMLHAEQVEQPVGICAENIRTPLSTGGIKKRRYLLQDGRGVCLYPASRRSGGACLNRRLCHRHLEIICPSPGSIPESHTPEQTRYSRLSKSEIDPRDDEDVPPPINPCQTPPSTLLREAPSFIKEKSFFPGVGDVNAAAEP